jgi:two-component sensor histidine kinase
MTPSPLELMKRSLTRVLRQQAALAAFGSFAFRETNLQSILDEAARICALGLGVSRAKVCQYRPMHNDLLIVAGFGWHEGIVKQVVTPADESSPQGRAYVTGEPVVCNDLEISSGFTLPGFYAEHGIASTIDVVVKGLDGPPFGILEIDSTERREYDEHDVNFLTGFANVLAEAVATASRVDDLCRAMGQMEVLLIEKDQLLTEKNVLAEELQHRVRNNLQLVSGMLAAQVRQTPDAQGQIGLRGIQARVTALANVYDQLLGMGLTGKVDFSVYARKLCTGLPDLRVTERASVVLTCDVTPMLLDLDVVTCLGLAITELVSNSYKHAFPDRDGHITVGGGPADHPGRGELTVRDDGIGYVKMEHENKRHGVGLVFRLMQQVSGSVAVHVSEGTTWTLAFPIPIFSKPV